MVGFSSFSFTNSSILDCCVPTSTAKFFISSKIFDIIGSLSAGLFGTLPVSGSLIGGVSGSFSSLKIIFEFCKI